MPSAASARPSTARWRVGAHARQAFGTRLSGAAAAEAGGQRQVLQQGRGRKKRRGCPDTMQPRREQRRTVQGVQIFFRDTCDSDSERGARVPMVRSPAFEGIAAARVGDYFVLPPEPYARPRQRRCRRTENAATQVLLEERCPHAGNRATSVVVKVPQTARSVGNGIAAVTARERLLNVRSRN